MQSSCSKSFPWERLSSAKLERRPRQYSDYGAFCERWCRLPAMTVLLPEGHQYKHFVPVQAFCRNYGSYFQIGRENRCTTSRDFLCRSILCTMELPGRKKQEGGNTRSSRKCIAKFKSAMCVPSYQVFPLFDPLLKQSTLSSLCPSRSPFLSSLITIGSTKHESCYGHVQDLRGFFFQARGRVCTESSNPESR